MSYKREYDKYLEASNNRCPSCGETLYSEEELNENDECLKCRKDDSTRSN